MEFMPWKEEYKVHYTEIDNQHAKMVQLVNELHSLLGSKKKETIKYIMKQLVEEAKIHFQTEEKLMTQNNYLDFISHKLEHDRYYNKLANFYSELQNEKESMNLEILNSFKTWFVNHLKINDKKLGGFLAEKQ